jgi:hypothetical protein
VNIGAVAVMLDLDWEVNEVGWENEVGEKVGGEEESGASLLVVSMRCQGDSLAEWMGFVNAYWSLLASREERCWRRLLRIRRWRAPLAL